MGITVRKMKPTVKTVRGKAIPAPNSDMDGNSQTSEVAEEVAPVAIAQAAPVAMAPSVKPASYTLAGTLAIIAFVFFTTLIILQVVEWNYHSDAFPHPVNTTQGPVAPPPPIEP